MAYNESLAQRIRVELQNLPGLTEKKMFGGVGFMVQGNMACGVNQDLLIVRVGPERYDEALKNPAARPFDMTGRPLTGWVTVSETGLQSQQAFREWLRWGVDFAGSLPPK